MVQQPVQPAEVLTIMDSNLAPLFIHSLITGVAIVWAGLWADPKIGWTVALLFAAAIILPGANRRTRRRSH